MRRVCFGIYQAFHGFRSYRVIHGTVVLSFALAMLMPCMAFSVIRDMGRNKPYQTRRAAETLQASVYLPSLDLSDHFEELFAADQPIVKLSVLTYGNARIRNLRPDAFYDYERLGDIWDRYFMYGVTSGFFDTAVIENIEGRLLEEADVAEARYRCVMGSTAAVNFDAALGDTLEINGSPYEIVGILHGYWWQGGIYVPYTRFGDVQASNVQHTFTVEYAKPPDWKALEESLTRKAGRVITFGSLLAEQKAFDATVMAENRNMLRLALITTLIAAVNVFFVLRGKTICALRSLAVKRAMGATTPDVFLEMASGNILQFLFSLPILLLFVELALALLPTVFRFSRDILVYAEVIGFGLALCTVLSVMLLASVNRMNVVNIMRKGK